MENSRCFGLFIWAVLFCSINAQEANLNQSEEIVQEIFEKSDNSKQELSRQDYNTEDIDQINVRLSVEKKENASEQIWEKVLKLKENFDKLNVKENIEKSIEILENVFNLVKDEKSFSGSFEVKLEKVKEIEDDIENKTQNTCNFVVSFSDNEELLQKVIDFAVKCQEEDDFSFDEFKKLFNVN
ncbi:hypothetical protein GF322_05215 [Candidatus Dependentiae bacterium]|nr:hypothetical protein [Candidatus Dependentiae bacterium]